MNKTLVAIIGWLCGIISGLWLGVWVEGYIWQRGAIKHKAAIWIVDQQTGKSKFVWRDMLSPEQWEALSKPPSAESPESTE